MTKDEKKISKLNAALKELMDIPPLIFYSEPTTQNQSKMLQGLARMYTDEGFRMYLEESIKSALKQVALKSESLIDMAAGKMRILTLKELLNTSKKSFEESEKIKIKKE